MWKYNEPTEELVEQPTMEEPKDHPSNYKEGEQLFQYWFGKWDEYIDHTKNLRRLAISGPHSWKHEQDVPEKEFEIKTSKFDVIEAYGLRTRVWTFNERSGYGCAECCTGDRCDEDCDAKYKGRRKECPHSKGKGWIKKEDVTAFHEKPAYCIPIPIPKVETVEEDREHDRVKHHLLMIKFLLAKNKGKKFYVECYPTDEGAIHFPNSNMAVKEIELPNPEDWQKQQQSGDQDELWNEAFELLRKAHHVDEIELLKSKFHITPKQ